MFLRGIELNEKNFVGVLYEVAERGDPEVVEALSEALQQDDSLKGSIIEVLGSFLTNGSPALANFAAQANYYLVIPPEKLIHALAREDLASVHQLRQLIASQLGDCIEKGRQAYTTDLRRLAADSSIDGALTPCFMKHDHDWFLSNLRLVLGADPQK